MKKNYHRIRYSAVEGCLIKKMFHTKKRALKWLISHPDDIIERIEWIRGERYFIPIAYLVK